MIKMINKIRLVIAFLFIGISFACNNEDKPAEENKTSAQKESPAPSSFVPEIIAVQPEAQDKPYKGQYCTITRAFRSNDTVFIEADYVDFLMGDAAVEAAKKHGEDGVVLDNYYVVNDNKKLRLLPLVHYVTIELVQADSAVQTYERRFETLGKIFGGNTLFVLTLDHGFVQKIKQQYLP